MRRELTGFIGLMVLGVLMAASAHAEVPPPPAPAPQLTWGPLEKFGRGVGNVLFGLLEIPSTTYERWDERDTIGSFFSGIGIGLVRGVARTVVGVFEVVTFPLPIPAHYAPIMRPLPYSDQHYRGGWKNLPAH